MIREYFPAADPNDRDALTAAYLKIWNHPDCLPYLSCTQLPFEEEMLSDWFRTQEERGVRYLVAEAAERDIQGIAITQADRLRGFALLGLAVHPQARRQGVGRGLVMQAVELGRELGYRAVDVDVFADNKRMLRLVIGLDFIPVKITHGERCDGMAGLRLKRYL